MHGLILRQNDCLFTYTWAKYEELYIRTVTFYGALWAVLLTEGTVGKHK
jgi:hypothetical protein